MTDDDLAAMEMDANALENDCDAGPLGRYGASHIRSLVAEVRRLRLKRAVAQALPPAAPHAHITEIDSCPHGG